MLALSAVAGPTAAAQVLAPASNTTQVTPPAAQTEVVLPRRIGVSGPPESLSLSEAIALALENNPAITIARLETEIAEYATAGARGAHDPALVSENLFEHRTTPIASIIGGGANGQTQQDVVTGSAGIRGLVPRTGGSFQALFSSSRFATDNQFVTLNPQFPASFSVSFTQPLGRGLTIDATRRQIEIASRTETLSESELRQRAIEALTSVEQAYWNLAFAHRNLDVQRQALEQTRRQVESNRRQVALGLLADIDVVEAETQAAVFEQNLYAAQEVLTRAENSLKVLIAPDRTAPLWGREIIPATSLTPRAPEVELGASVAAALVNRPELDQLEASLEINQVEERFQRDQARPQVDLVGSYSLSGLAGSLVDRGPNLITAGNAVLQERVDQLSTQLGLAPLPPPQVGPGIPTGFLGGYGQSLRSLVEGAYPTARLDLRIGLPLGNRVASANVARTLVQRQQLRVQRDQLQAGIEAEVRNVMQAVRSAQARVTAAGVARASAQRQYESEQRRFDTGLSTVFLVLQRQTDAVAAQARELQAQADLANAIVTLRRATGQTLDIHNVRVRRGGARP
ncbi:MAG: TolC family protein [Vicinamibacterales bacterium]